MHGLHLLIESDSWLATFGNSNPVTIAIFTERPSSRKVVIKVKGHTAPIFLC